MTFSLMRLLAYGFALLSHYSGLDMLYRLTTGAGLVVLMLHRVRDEFDPYPLSISRRSLLQLIGWLRVRDKLTGLDAGLESLASGARGMRYALTFDDGYRDNLALLEDDFETPPAVIYIATDHVGADAIWAYRLSHAVEFRTRQHLDLGEFGLGHFDLSDEHDRTRAYSQLPPRLKQMAPDQLRRCVSSVLVQMKPEPDNAPDMLDWQEVRRMHDAGLQIGAHTRNHILLSRADDAEAREEIAGSYARVAEETGEPPRHFAYPNGTAADFGDRDVQMVRDAGFRTATTTIEGINRPGVDPFRLRRINVHETRFHSPMGRMSRALFFSETSGLLGALRTWRAAAT